METMRLQSAEMQATFSSTREIPDQHWQEKANCIEQDRDIFFPDRGERQKLKLARAICADCVVQEECLDYAMGNAIKHGVWGGLSERQRRIIRRGEQWKNRT